MNYKELRTGQVVYTHTLVNYDYITSFYLVLGMLFDRRMQRYLCITDKLTTKLYLYPICTITCGNFVDETEKTAKDFLRYQLCSLFNRPMQSNNFVRADLYKMELVLIRPKIEDTKVFMLKNKLNDSKVQDMLKNCQFVEEVVPKIDRILLQKKEFFEKLQEPRKKVKSFKQYQLYYLSNDNNYYICMNNKGTKFLRYSNESNISLLEFILLKENDMFYYRNNIERTKLILNAELRKDLEDTSINIYDFECNRTILEAMNNECK